MMRPFLATGQEWYVAFTQPSAESRAVFHLENQGFPTYLPKYLKRRKKARRVEQIQVPLFPRYVFLGIDVMKQRWRSVNGTIGISHLVCQGDHPIKLDRRVIEAISAREDEGGLVQLSSLRSFRIGQPVRVTDGAFADQLGLYEGVCDQERVRILLDLLGRKVKVVIEAEMLEAV
jgi:transcriptional antiterminator RfaH